MGACAGDFDNDGRTDLYVTNYGPNALYRNAGNGAFTDVTRDGAASALARWSTSCAFLDFDRDGDLDLFVTNYLDAPPSNNQFCGDPQRPHSRLLPPAQLQSAAERALSQQRQGRRSPTSAPRPASPTHAATAWASPSATTTTTGWPDVFVANDARAELPVSQRGQWPLHGGRARRPASRSPRDGKPRAGMGTEFGDYDGDGRLDLVVTNHEFETHSLFRNVGKRLVRRRDGRERASARRRCRLSASASRSSTTTTTARSTWRSSTAMSWTTPRCSAPGSTLRAAQAAVPQHDGRRFAEVGRAGGPGLRADKVGRTLVAGDIDNDGDLDLLVDQQRRAARSAAQRRRQRRHALIVRIVGPEQSRRHRGAGQLTARAARRCAR